MLALLVSFAAVAIAEIGDKTQLLALLLAARYRRPLPIIMGILVATVLNHALAAWLGSLAAAALVPEVLRWLIAGSLFAMALWLLHPDSLDQAATPSNAVARSAFAATTIAFFLAEIGDKTQIATVALAAQYAPALVVVGSTLGLLAVNAPLVVAGDRYAGRLPLRALRIAACALFALFGAFALLR